MLKLTPGGAFQSVYQIGSTSEDRAHGIAARSTGIGQPDEIHVTGHFAGNVVFGAGIGDANRIVNGGADAYSLKLTSANANMIFDSVGTVAGS